MKQKTRLQSIIILFLIIGCFASCKRSDIQEFQDTDGIFIYKAQYDDHADSTTYSFATKNTNTVKDTIWIPVRIMGKAVDRDRKIDFEPVDSLTTAVQGEHYTLLTPYVIPADSFSTNLGVVINRTDDLQDTTVRLVMRLMPTNVFPHILDQHGDYVITINDELSKPDNWDSMLIYYFGDYSEVKYRFIIDVLHRSEFPVGAGGLEIAEIMAYESQLQIALTAYNNAHPGHPLKDEKGNRISFQ